MIKCPNCTAQLSPGTTVCWACKHPLNTAPQPPSSPPILSRTPQAAAPSLQSGSLQSAPQLFATAKAMVDAQPIVERSVHGVFTKAEDARNRICAVLERELAARGVKALTLKSLDYEHPCWVKVWCWVPVGTGRTVTERTEVTIAIQTRAYHTYELEFTVTANGKGGNKHKGPLYDLSDSELANVADFVIGRRRNLQFTRRIRQFDWQLWRPKNEIDAVRIDWLAASAGLLLVLGLITAVFGIGIFILALWVGLLIYLKRRKVLVRTSGKPMFEPRLLIRVDSWQAVVTGAGIDSQRIYQQFMATLANSPGAGFNARVERIWYWGLDTKEEREQIVITFGRGIVFCQIHPYGDDLYVSWDGHLNKGTWVEQSVKTGIDRATNCLTEIRAVTPGSQGLSEYDVTDLSCLIEWVHLRIVQIVKDYLARKQIDQEIDFQIQRGNRQNLTQTAGGPPASAKGFVRRVRQAITHA
jgi:hypothetical protein